MSREATAISVTGHLKGAFKVSSPVQVGPARIEPADPYPAFQIVLADQMFDADHRAGMTAAMDHAVAVLQATLALCFDAVVEAVALQSLDVLIDGQWEQVQGMLTMRSRVVPDLAGGPVRGDPATAFAALKTEPEKLMLVQFYELAVLAKMTMLRGSVASVPLLATLVEAAGSRPSSLEHAESLSNDLRSRGHPIPPNPSRHPQQIRSSVAHHSPKNQQPTGDEVRWFETVAAAWLTEEIR